MTDPISSCVFHLINAIPSRWPIVLLGNINRLISFSGFPNTIKYKPQSSHHHSLVISQQQPTAQHHTTIPAPFGLAILPSCPHNDTVILLLSQSICSKSIRTTIECILEWTLCVLFYRGFSCCVAASTYLLPISCGWMLYDQPLPTPFIKSCDTHCGSRQRYRHSMEFHLNARNSIHKSGNNCKLLEWHIALEQCLHLLCLLFVLITMT